MKETLKQKELVWFFNKFCKFSPNYYTNGVKDDIFMSYMNKFLKTKLLLLWDKGNLSNDIKTTFQYCREEKYIIQGNPIFNFFITLKGKHFISPMYNLWEILKHPFILKLIPYIAGAWVIIKLGLEIIKNKL